MPYTDDPNELFSFCVAVLTRFFDTFRNHEDVIFNSLDCNRYFSRASLFLQKIPFINTNKILY